MMLTTPTYTLVLSSSSAAASLKRFTSIRGKPSDIFSDCGTNFVGADREMKEFITLMKSDVHNTAITNFLSLEGIQWHFIPPGAPHLGGLWEAVVKSVKFHLHRVLLLRPSHLPRDDYSISSNYCLLEFQTSHPFLIRSE